MIFAGMIDGEKSWRLVMAGRKTQTWRQIKLADECGPLGCPYPNWVYRNDRLLWAVGRTYALQPGRGKKAIGRIRITKIVEQTPGESTEADIVAEGFSSGDAGRAEFYECLARLYSCNGEDVATMPGVSLLFETASLDKLTKLRDSEKGGSELGTVTDDLRRLAYGAE